MLARRLATAGALAALLSSAAVARAAGPLGPDGTTIATSDYRVDLTQGVVLAGTRVLGLAGAYVAIAEGVDGNALNPVAPAMRPIHSYDHTDYDFGLGVTFPAAVSGNDLFNSGDRTSVSASQSDALFLDLAANLQLGRWGVGASVHYTTFEVAPDGQSLGLNARFGGIRLQVARSWFDGQFLLGLGSRGTGLLVENQNPRSGEPKQLFHIEGAAAELGALFRPNDDPYRIGVAVRSAVVTNELKSVVEKDAAGDRIISGTGGDLYLPNEVTLPWDIDMGLALQLGPRPLNPRWIEPDEALARLDRYLRWKELERARRKRALAAENPSAARQAALDAESASDASLDELHRERALRALRERLRQRAKQLERFYVLISTSLLITGPVRNSVGVESFIERRVQRSGKKATYTPRLGVEAEVVPHWLKLRAGSYGEPTRFESRGARARLHGTLGFDQKLFPWTVFGIFDEDTEWRLAAALDGARHYFSWGLSVGVWR